MRPEPAQDARDEGWTPAGPAEGGTGRRRYTTRQKAVASVLAVCFLVLLAYPFFFSPRVRYFFTPVPRIAREPLPAPPTPVPVDVKEDDVHRAETVVFNEVRRGAFPGAALAVGQRGQALAEEGYGRLGWTRLSSPVDPGETLYDLASLTKLVATTTAVMLLVEDGRMKLDDPVVRWLPRFRGKGREKVTVRQLLAHTSGLPAGVPRAHPLEGETARERLNNLIATIQLADSPGAGVNYSDVGFVVLGEAAARAAGEPLPRLLRRRVWEPLGMTATRFQPGLVCLDCAPTLSLHDGSPFAGKTNDPLARELGGVTGNAGLFSTAHDVGRFAAMLASGGELDGVRVLQASTVREFMQVQKGTRALGFEIFCREGTVPDHKGCKTPYAYGHTGYTGTSLWIEPERGIWVVLLTNRTYNPRAANRIRLIRRRIYNMVIGIQPRKPPAADTVAKAEPDSAEH